MTGNALLEQQLKRLRDAIQYKPPFCSGTTFVEQNDLDIFYSLGETSRYAPIGTLRDERRALTGTTCRRINPKTTSDERLAEFSGLCAPATFGLDGQDVLDETYRKAGKLDTSDFLVRLDVRSSGIIDKISSFLLEGYEAQRGIVAELYKLNIYGELSRPGAPNVKISHREGPGSFFKSHKDTPRGTDQFGSLVIIYPTVHDGGSLIFREGRKAWTFDSAFAMSGRKEACVAYAAFYSDVDHEVTTVNSGYRITVTYNLRFTQTRLPIVTPSLGMLTFQSALEKLLRDPSFLPEGGLLGFGLRHVYPIDIAVSQNQSALLYLNFRLKGSDADIQAAAETLLLDAHLWMLYSERDGTVVCPQIPAIHPNQQSWDFSDESLALYLRDHARGQVIPRIVVNKRPPRRHHRPDALESDDEEPEVVEDEEEAEASLQGESDADESSGSGSGESAKTDEEDPDGEYQPPSEGNSEREGEGGGVTEPVGIEMRDESGTSGGNDASEQVPADATNPDPTQTEAPPPDSARNIRRTLDRWELGRTIFDAQPIWVTRPSDLTVLKRPLVRYGNQAELGYTYGHAVLIVRVGKPGERTTAFDRSEKYRLM